MAAASRESFMYNVLFVNGCYVNIIVRNILKGSILSSLVTRVLDLWFEWSLHIKINDDVGDISNVW